MHSLAHGECIVKCGYGAMPSGVAYGGSVAALSPTGDDELNATSAAIQQFPSLQDERSLANGNDLAKDRDIRRIAEKVLRGFNTWAFKREQPSDPQLMLRVIESAVVKRDPIEFVLYWGKGPRHRSSALDEQCLDFLVALTSRVAASYEPGTAVSLILTDTHAELNGHSSDDIRRYFQDVTAAAARRGFATHWLGQLVRAAGAVATAAPLDDSVSETMLTSLIGSAQKWYRGSGTARDGALTYLRMNLIEQRVVERAFPRSIFITFNGSELRGLFPRQLPIFYMYSLRRGVSVKPWFLPSDPEQPSPA